MSKLTSLLKKLQALVEQGTKAFEEAGRIDIQIMDLIDRARDILGGGDEPSKNKPATRQRVTGREAQSGMFVSRPKGGRTPSLQEPIREVLEKNNNEPMSQDEILAALMDKGVNVRGKRPKHTLSAHVSYLIAKDFLVRTEQGRIALKQRLLIQPRSVAERTH